MNVQVLLSEKSEELRSRYLEAFIDTNCEYYKKYIDHKTKFSDGMHYTGYLWDCLRAQNRITFPAFQSDICNTMQVYVLADDLSRDRVLGAPLWPWPAYSVIALSPNKLLQLLDALPEDLYVFDLKMAWTRIITHEHDNQARICLAVDAT